MTRFGRSYVYCFALTVLVSVGACGGKDSKSGDTPCASGALLHVRLSPNVATMTAPTFSICRNDTCYAWAPGGFPKSNTSGTTEYLSVPTGSAYSIAATTSRNADATFGLDVEWDFVDPSLLQDGDRYTITLANGSGAATSIFDQTASYTRTASDGMDSGSACLQTKLSG